MVCNGKIRDTSVVTLYFWTKDWNFPNAGSLPLLMSWLPQSDTYKIVNG